MPFVWPFIGHLVLLWGLALAALTAALGGLAGSVLWATGHAELLARFEVEPVAAPIIMVIGGVVAVPAGMGAVHLLLLIRGRRRLLIDARTAIVRESFAITLPLLPWPSLPVAWRTWRLDEFDRVEAGSDGLRLRGPGEVSVLAHRAIGRRQARRHGEDLARICGLPLVEEGGVRRAPDALDEPLVTALARSGPPPAPLSPAWMERSADGRCWRIRATPAAWLRPLLIMLACLAIAVLGGWYAPEYRPSPHEGLAVEAAAIPSLWPWRLHQAWVGSVRFATGAGWFAAAVSAVWTLCLLAAHRRSQEVQLGPGRIAVRRPPWPWAGELGASEIEDVRIASAEVLIVADRRWLRLALPSAGEAPAVRDALLRHLSGAEPWAGEARV